MDRLAEKFEIQGIVENDPELKRKISIDIHYVRAKELQQREEMEQEQR